MKKLTTAILLLLQTSLYGLYDTTPFSYEAEISDGMILAMIGPPITDEHYPYFDRVTQYAKDIEKELREKFPKSGLYRLENEELTPIWTSDRYSRVCDVSENGRFLVSMDYVWEERQDRIIRFYDNGTFLAQHNITEILDGSDYGDGPSPASFYRKIIPLHEHEPAFWGITEDNKKFRFESMNGDILVFDLSTGKILKSYNLNDRAFIFLLSLFILSIGSAMIYYYKRNPNQSAHTTPAIAPR